MKLIAEEKKTGTLELLQTKPISDWNIILGKFLASLMMIGIALALSLPYYITIASLGPIDHGAVWMGYLGLVLMSGVYISIGLFTSSITNNQIVSFLLALLISIMFHYMFGVIASGISGFFGSLLIYLDMYSHIESISRGVLDITDVIYFLSFIFLGLISTELVMSKRNVID
jgi:ABC-2 type transport system permease protein